MEKCGFTNTRNMVFKEKIAINSTPRFQTDCHNSVRQCFRLLHVEIFGPIIKPVFFLQNLAVGNNYSSSFLLICFIRPQRNIELRIIRITVRANTMFPDDISQG